MVISRYAPNQEVATTLSARDHKGPSCGRDGVTGNPIVTEHPNLMPYTGKGFGEWKVGVGTIRASGGTFGGGSETIVAYPLQDGREIGKQQNGLGIGGANDPAYTVDCTGAQAVATQAIAFDVYNSKLTGDVMGVVREQHGTNTNAVLIPTYGIDSEKNCHKELIGALRSPSGGFEGVVAIAKPTQPVTFQENGFGTITLNEIANPLTCGGGKPGQGYAAILMSEKAVGVDLYNNTTTGDVHVPLRTAGGHGAPACLEASAPYVVRRLTPRECERLQGFPDDWTAIPFRGKPASDGPRYKALGNSMAVNCMEWIGERIAAYEARKSA
jgi:hypothetical protein